MLQARPEEVESSSSNKIHQTWGPPFSQTLYRARLAYFVISGNETKYVLLYTCYLFAVKFSMIYLVSTVHKLKFQVGAALPLRRQRGRVRQLQGLLPQGRPERQQQVSGP